MRLSPEAEERCSTCPARRRWSRVRAPASARPSPACSRVRGPGWRCSTWTRRPRAPLPRRSGPRAASASRGAATSRTQARSDGIRRRARPVRTARHPGQQRRHRPRGRPGGHERGGLRPRLPRQRQGRLPLRSARRLRSCWGRAAASSSTWPPSPSLVGVPERFAYSMSKGAVLTMTRSIAVDYMKQNIRCNCICPARVHTPFVDGYVAANYPGPGGGDAPDALRVPAHRPHGHARTRWRPWPSTSARTRRRSSRAQAYPIDGGVLAT